MDTQGEKKPCIVSKQVALDNCYTTLKWKVIELSNSKNVSETYTAIM